MANIVYLRPQDRPDRNKERSEEPPRLKTALSLAHLAALLTGETVTRNASLSAKVAAMLSRMDFSGDSPSKTSALTSLPATLKPAALPRRVAAGAGDVAALTRPPAASDAFAAAAVIGGHLHILDAGESSSAESRTAPARLKSHFIAVPDNILVARQNRTGTTAFSVRSLETLASTIEDILRHNKHMVENWAGHGGRPPLNLRFQARLPFGRMAHAGATTATDLRAVAVRMTREQGAGQPYVAIEMALSHRGS
jgi:hypothetical protein